jgi:hypothetical protein
MLPGNVQKETAMAKPGIELPPLPLEGGCQCRAVRYAITGRPIVFYLCHCRECQRHTSSAFGESLRVRKADLSVDGRLSQTRRVSDAGNVRLGLFCPDCGVRLYHATEGSETVNVKAGTLDDARWLVPAGHIWTGSRQRFFPIGSDELAYEGQPPDGYAALTRRWEEMIAQS